VDRTGGVRTTHGAIRIRNAHKILVGELEGKSGHLEDLEVDGKIILKGILRKYVGRV
jgi:hypothetical protein